MKPQLQKNKAEHYKFICIIQAINVFTVRIIVAPTGQNWESVVLAYKP
jgi:hypothetical protein